MQLSDNARSVLMMNIAMASFTINDTATKLAMVHVPMAQVLTLRGGCAALALFLIALQLGALRYRPGRRDLVTIGLRTLVDVAATLTFVSALGHMKLANLTAILQALPLVVTLAAALIFGERIGWRRLLAILVGLLGVLIILNPRADGFDRWAVLGLISVLCVAARDLLTRRISRGVPSSLIALASAVALTVTGGAGVAVEGWSPMTLRDLGLILLAAMAVIIGYLTIVGTMRIGDVGLVAPFRYMSLLWAIILGWLVFGVLPDRYMLLGAALVVGSGIFTLMRERNLGRRRQG